MRRAQRVLHAAAAAPGSRRDPSRVTYGIDATRPGRRGRLRVGPHNQDPSQRPLCTNAKAVFSTSRREDGAPRRGTLERRLCFI